MSIKALISKIADFDTAIESIEYLIISHGHQCLKPTLNYLKEQKQITVRELSTFKMNIEVQCEEVNRLSHI